jgi:hypothetical protein
MATRVGRRTPDSRLAPLLQGCGGFCMRDGWRECGGTDGDACRSPDARFAACAAPTGARRVLHGDGWRECGGTDGDTCRSPDARFAACAAPIGARRVLYEGRLARMRWHRWRRVSVAGRPIRGLRRSYRGAAGSVGAAQAAKAAVRLVMHVGWRSLAVRATPSLNKSPPPRTAAGAPSWRSGRSCRRCSRRSRAACPRAPSPGTAAAGCGGRR